MRISFTQLLYHHVMMPLGSPKPLAVLRRTGTTLAQPAWSSGLFRVPQRQMDGFQCRSALVASFTQHRRDMQFALQSIPLRFCPRQRPLVVTCRTSEEAVAATEFTSQSGDPITGILQLSEPENSSGVQGGCPPLLGDEAAQTGAGANANGSSRAVGTAPVGIPGSSAEALGDASDVAAGSRSKDSAPTTAESRETAAKTPEGSTATSEVVLMAPVSAAAGGEGSSSLSRPGAAVVDPAEGHSTKASTSVPEDPQVAAPAVAVAVGAAATLSAAAEAPVSYNSSSSSSTSSGGGTPPASGDGSATAGSSTNSSSSGPPPGSDLGRPGLALLSGAAMLPHPEKAHRGGEDSYFIADHQGAVGVADGVGGWAEIGIDAGAYARLLMAHAKDAAEAALQDSQDSLLSAQDILEVAYFKTNVQGSSTACVVVLNDKTLSASNLGDSGFVVIRGGRTSFQSPQQQHNFNFPYQLGSAESMSDQPQSAMRFELNVQPGDIVVLGSDGLWDNVFSEEVATIASRCFDKGETPETAAGVICRYARMRASDSKYHSPFSYAAMQAGYVYLGGKMDDITVVVSYVQQPSKL